VILPVKIVKNYTDWTRQIWKKPQHPRHNIGVATLGRSLGRNLHVAKDVFAVSSYWLLVLGQQAGYIQLWAFGKEMKCCKEQRHSRLEHGEENIDKQKVEKVVLIDQVTDRLGWPLSNRIWILGRPISRIRIRGWPDRYVKYGSGDATAGKKAIRRIS